MNANWKPASHYRRDRFTVDGLVLVALMFGIVFALLIAA